MRTMKSLWAVLVMGCVAAAGISACNVESEGPAPEAPASEAPAAEPGPASEEVVLGWALDVSALKAAPDLALPAARLRADAFEPARVQRDVLGASEPFELTGRVRSRERFESGAFVMELDPVQGKLLALRRDERRPAAEEADMGALEVAARERVRALGIPDEEVVSVVTRRLLAQDDTRETRAAAPRLVAYKTFVMRGFGGVRVEGHRAVITHDPDGTLRKVLVSWPALAEAGHRLRTPMTLPEIEREVATRLTALGRPQGRASLSWAQTPSVDENGQVRLTLKVAARLPAVDHGEIVEEPEVEMIDVAAAE